jgi:hypothetical protein
LVRERRSSLDDEHASRGQREPKRQCELLHLYLLIAISPDLTRLQPVDLD